MVVPLAIEAGPVLHPGDFHAAAPEPALCTFGRLLGFNSLDSFFQRLFITTQDVLLDLAI